MSAQESHSTAALASAATVSGLSATRRFVLTITGILMLGGLLLTYANHFDNDFHFDDSHTIEDNLWIRDLSNTGAFFSDPTTRSTLPTNRQYRPALTLTLAVDYWLGDGLDPFWFHASTFVWYVAQLVAMFFLFRVVLRVKPILS